MNTTPTKTIVDRISEIATFANPPSIQVNRLPGHDLIRFNKPCFSPADGSRKVYSTTVFAGGPHNNWDPFEYKLYHVMERPQRQIPDNRYCRPAPWFKPPMQEFALQHCRTCPHMLAASRATTTDSPLPCPAATGYYDQAFREDHDTGFHRCMAGHPAPQTDPEARYEPPTIWFGPHPVSYTLIIDPTTGTGTRHNLWVMDMKLQHLLYDGTTYAASGFTAPLPNTWSNGGVCWGGNTPEMPEITDRIQRSVFNLDLTNYEQFRHQLNNYQRFDAKATDVYMAVPIPDERIVSVNGEVNAILCASNHNQYKDGWRMLVASGVPHDELGVFMPLKQHSIVLPDRVINGYVTPIIPAIGRCWFVQSYMDDNHYSHHGLLLGQIDPPPQLS